MLCYALIACYQGCQVSYTVMVTSSVNTVQSPATQRIKQATYAACKALSGTLAGSKQHRGGVQHASKVQDAAIR